MRGVSCVRDDGDPRYKVPIRLSGGSFSSTSEFSLVSEEQCLQLHGCHATSPDSAERSTATASPIVLRIAENGLSRGMEA